MNYVHDIVNLKGLGKRIKTRKCLVEAKRSFMLIQNLDLLGHSNGSLEETIPLLFP